MGTKEITTLMVHSKSLMYFVRPSRNAYWLLYYSTFKYLWYRIWETPNDNFILKHPVLTYYIDFLHFLSVACGIQFPLSVVNRPRIWVFCEWSCFYRNIYLDKANFIWKTLCLLICLYLWCFKIYWVIL